MGSRVLYKNLICLSFGLFAIFLTLMFAIENYFSEMIDNSIESVSILRDAKVGSWGSQPNLLNSTYTHTIDFVKKGQQPIPFDFSFKYVNISFAQGNSGTIKYLNQWHRTPTTPLPPTVRFSSLNLALQRIFSYDFYAPTSRKFVVSHNLLLRSLKQDFLPKFYATYLYQYYFSNRSKVVSNILYCLTPSEQQSVYGDEEWGMSTPHGLMKWLRLSSLAAPQTHPYFEQLQAVHHLNGSALMHMVGNVSVAHNLQSALNGTIRARVRSKEYNTINLCEPVCSEEELIAIQLADGMLTRESLMGGMGLNTSTHEFNGTWGVPVEYTVFCERENLTAIENSNVLRFFADQMLSDYGVMSQAYNNRDKYSIIQSIFKLEEADGQYHQGQSVIKYVQYLYDRLYNRNDRLKHTATLYKYFTRVMYDFKSVVMVELYTRAMHYKYHYSTCKEYFGGEYAQWSYLCGDTTTDFQSMESKRSYVMAYFNLNRQFILGHMDRAAASRYLKLDERSPFVVQMHAVRDSLYDQFNTTDIYELVAGEWGGEGGVFDNLPSYFTRNESIGSWDVGNALKGCSPQYRLMRGGVINRRESRVLLDASVGLGNLYNMNELSDFWLEYIGEVVIECGFGGLYEERPMEEWVGGYESAIVNDHNAINSSFGGAPWLSAKVQLLQTQSEAERFSMMNTGIYDSCKVRSMYEVNELKTIGSYYTIYRDDNGSVIQVIEGSKAILGTNLLGFNADLSPQGVLTAYVEEMHGEISLLYDGTRVRDAFEVYLYRVKSEVIGVGLAEQNQRYIAIVLLPFMQDPESYVVIEPVTGITISYHIKYHTYTLSYVVGGEDILLYDSVIEYDRVSVRDINEIAMRKQQMIKFEIGIIAAGAMCMVLIIVFSVLYCCTRKKRVSLIDPLIADSIESVQDAER